MRPLRCSYLQRRRDRQGPYFTYEVIIVDDGSRDGTVQVAADFARKHGFDAVRVLRLPQNRGKGYAGWHGYLRARSIDWPHYSAIGSRGLQAKGGCRMTSLAMSLLDLHSCSQVGHVVLARAAIANDGRGWCNQGVRPGMPGGQAGGDQQ